MEKIRGYEVILTFSPTDEITGHIFEVFDYYLFLRDYFKVGMLFIGSISLDKLKDAFEDKYIVPFAQIEEDLIFYTLDDVKTGKNIFCFDSKTFVLVCDGNIHAMQAYRITFLTKLLYGFMCFSGEQLISGYGNTMFSHMTYLADYRIYTNRIVGFKTIDYVKKLPFKHYKKHSRIFDNTGMMYMTFQCRKISPYTVLDYFWKSKCSKALLVVPKILDQYENLEGVEQVVAPVKNFFSQFDTYIYTPVARHFDCSPRLVTECYMQGKNVLVDLDYVDLGLQTRLKDCQTSLQSLDLCDGDQIVGIINSARSSIR